jgi:hypothetical protein
MGSNLRGDALVRADVIMAGQNLLGNCGSATVMNPLPRLQKITASADFTSHGTRTTSYYSSQYSGTLAVAGEWERKYQFRSLLLESPPYFVVSPVNCCASPSRYYPGVNFMTGNPELDFKGTEEIICNLDGSESKTNPCYVLTTSTGTPRISTLLLVYQDFLTWIVSVYRGQLTTTIIHTPPGSSCANCTTAAQYVFYASWDIPFTKIWENPNNLLGTFEKEFVIPYESMVGDDVINSVSTCKFSLLCE